jgi:hypothetical protein
MTTATIHALRLGLNLVSAGIVIAVLANYPGLIAPAAIAAAVWFGMIGLARVHPTAAVLIYSFVCGCRGLRWSNRNCRTRERHPLRRCSTRARPARCCVS